MIEAVRGYLLRITAGAFAGAILLAALPKGTPRRVAAMLCVLLMLLLALTPLAELDYDSLAEAISRLELEKEEARTGIEIQNQELVASIISGRVQTYILDKASSLGMQISVELEMETRAATPYPSGVTIRGAATPTQKQQLQTYLENGGKVLLTTSGYTETPDLDAVMAQFGLAREPGLVVEGDAGHALYGYPYSLFPDYAAADESTALDGVNQSTHVMLSVAQGITITETDDVTAEPLLYTTEDAYSKQDFDASSSSAKEAGDTDGPFSLAVWARNDSTGAEVIWIGCPNMDNEQVYQSIPGNLTFLQGCAASLVGQSLLIDTKALEAAPITVPASASMTLGMVFVFVLPAAVLIAGAVEVLLRRRR